MPDIGWAAARVFAFVAYYSGGLRVFERVDRTRHPGARCTVLSYHRVNSEQVGYRDIAVSPRTFRSHIAYLTSHGYAFLSLSQYHEFLAGARALERDSVVLTFDDGYRDNYTAALPVLRESGVPAAIFLCTGPLDTGVPLWWDRVAGLVRRGRDAGVRTLDPDAGLPEPVRALCVEGLTGNARRASRAIGRLIDVLKERPAAERERALAAMEGAMPSGGPSDEMLTWDMVREMCEARIGFGAHSVSHPVFSQITAEAARLEVAGSKASIERHLGEEVTAFAYPYGKDAYFDRATIDSLRACGFRWGYTTENGRNDPHADPYTLRRDGMRDVPAYVLAVRLAGVFEHPLLRRVRSLVEGRHAAADRE